MARAVFELVGDSTSVIATLNTLPGAARTVARAMRGEFVRAFSDTSRSARSSSSHIEKEYARASAASRRAAEEAKRAGKGQTKAVEAEVNYRTNARKREADEAVRQEQRITTNAERESRKRTAAAQRDARDRARATRQSGSVSTSFGGVASRAASGAVSFGSAAIGATRSELERTAGIEMTANRALQNAGYTDMDELRAARQRMVDRAGELRMDPEVVAEALRRGQEFGNILGGDTATNRRTNLDAALANVQFARDVGEDPAEILRIQGVAQRSGIRDEATQRMLMRSLVGMARAGSVSLGAVSNEALGGMMQNLAGEFARGGAGADRAATTSASLQRSMAVAQVGAAAGLTPRDTMAALTKMDRTLQNARPVGRLRDRLLDTEGGRGVADKMFTSSVVNGRTQWALRDSRSENVMSQLTTAYGGDTTAMMNAMGPNGAGLVFDSQQRRLFSSLGSQTEGGRTIADTILAMQSNRVTVDDERFGARLYEESEAARLERDRETRRRNLAAPGVGADVTREVDRFAAEHPYLSMLGGLFGGGAMGGLAKLFGGGGAAALKVTGVAATGATVVGAGGVVLGAGAAMNQAARETGGNTVGGLLDRARAERASPSALAQTDAANLATLNSTAQRTQFGGMSGEQLARILSDAVRDGARAGTREGVNNPMDNAHRDRVERQGGPGNPSR